MNLALLASVEVNLLLSQVTLMFQIVPNVVIKSYSRSNR